MNPAIHLNDVGLSYQHKAVFSHINLEIYPKEWLAILGTSGVGKTSLIRLLAGLCCKQETITGTISTNNNQPLAKQVAYMAQQDMLLPWLNAFDNAMLSANMEQLSTQEYLRKQELTDHLLDQVGLHSDKTLFPYQLSGGMRQRVALVRTLIQDKPFILMDEPFSALDTITRHQLHELACTLLKDKTVIFITHDPQEALRLADKIYLMSGLPAQLRMIAKPNQHKPRDIYEQQHAELHAHIFSELTKGYNAYENH